MYNFFFLLKLALLHFFGILHGFLWDRHLRENWFEMSDLFSSLLIFTIIKTILSTFFFTVSKFYKNIVKWALTEMLCSVAGTTTVDRECCIVCPSAYDICLPLLVFSNFSEICWCVKWIIVSQWCVMSNTCKIFSILVPKRNCFYNTPKQMLAFIKHISHLC